MSNKDAVLPKLVAGGAANMTASFITQYVLGCLGLSGNFYFLKFRFAAAALPM